MKKLLSPDTWLFPTPAVLVTCKEAGRRANIITLAWAGVVASEPPIIQISIRPGRYSHDIILKSREFVVNIPDRKLLKAVDLCGTISGRKVDKFKEAGLTKAKASQVAAPLIAECPVNLECKVEGNLRFGTHTHILGEIVAIQCEDRILDESGKPDIEKLDPIAFYPIANEYYSLGKLLEKYGFARKIK